MFIAQAPALRRVLNGLFVVLISRALRALGAWPADGQARFADLEVRVSALERIISAGRSAGSVSRGTGVRTGELRAQAQRLMAEGCTQAEAARRLGVTRQYVHKLIRRTP